MERAHYRLYVTVARPTVTKGNGTSQQAYTATVVNVINSTMIDGNGLNTGFKLIKIGPVCHGQKGKHLWLFEPTASCC